MLGSEVASFDLGDLDRAIFPAVLQAHGADGIVGVCHLALSPAGRGVFHGQDADPGGDAGDCMADVVGHEVVLGELRLEADVAGFVEGNKEVEAAGLAGFDRSDGEAFAEFVADEEFHRTTIGRPASGIADLGGKAGRTRLAQ